MSQAAGQVNNLVFLLKIKFSPCMPINFVMQGKCLFSDISRPAIFIMPTVWTLMGLFLIDLWEQSDQGPYFFAVVLKYMNR